MPLLNKTLFLSIFILSTTLLKTHNDKLEVSPPRTPTPPLTIDLDPDLQKRAARRKRFGPSLFPPPKRLRRRTSMHPLKPISYTLPVEPTTPLNPPKSEEELEAKKQMEQNRIDDFVHAAHKGNLDVIEEWLEPTVFRRRKDSPEEFHARSWIVSKRDRYGHTALHAASIRGHIDIVHYLLQKEELNLINQLSGYTGGLSPIMYAAFCGKARVLKELLKSSQLDVNLRDEQGRTALHLAAQGKKYAAKMKNPCEQVMDPLTPSYDAIIDLLLNDGRINPDQPDNRGNTYWSIIDG